MMEKEAKKEAFRKYLESSGIVDALTKVLVALYEQNHKPASAVEFVQQKLGGPSLAEYEKLQADMSELQSKYDELLAVHQETSRQLEQYKSSSVVGTSEETLEDRPQNSTPKCDMEESMHKLEDITLRSSPLDDHRL
ncbi:uncharacterized protein LOC141619687 [Silene latifolia]|uniref:uncharacterized protein LOC141619687 n=1 Tax=Silene latifolia TaxID=37657 RepID=UPI003D778600